MGCLDARAWRCGELPLRGETQLSGGSARTQGDGAGRSACAARSDWPRGAEPPAPETRYSTNLIGAEPPAPEARYFTNLIGAEPPAPETRYFTNLIGAEPPAPEELYLTSLKVAWGAGDQHACAGAQRV